jgi:hypothetical protein
MHCDFRPFTGAKIYARALDRAVPFVVASMFTGNLRDSADRLARSINNFALNFVIYEVPAIHRSISPVGSDDLAFCKPNFIHYLLNEYRTPILYVDADVVLREFPEVILGHALQKTTFACYNWLAGDPTDAYRPVRVNVDGTVTKNRFYKFSHAIDYIDPTQLLVSGAVQYYAPDACPLLRGWISTIGKFSAVDDDESLDYAYNFLVSKRGIRSAWLSKEYCRYLWWIYVKPIIDHPQFPAIQKTERAFRIATGKSCFNSASCQVQSARGPFPRDCLIDTKEKQLLRADEKGALTVIGKFSTSLWLD